MLWLCTRVSNIYMWASLEELLIKKSCCHVDRVIPQYLMYRPANSVPYATVELDLQGDFQTYCMVEPKGKLITKTASEVEQKCCVFQHWIHEWTHGNLLVTRLEGELQRHQQTDEFICFVYLWELLKHLCILFWQVLILNLQT